MKAYCLIVLLFVGIGRAIAQPMPHGMVYGQKPNTLGMISATKLETFMGKHIRISITISGRVSRVTKAKGGWFILEAGKDREIEAHFKNYDIIIPGNLKGRNVIVEGVAQKQLSASGVIHIGEGKTARTPSQKNANAHPKLTFEVTGIMVD